MRGLAVVSIALLGLLATQAEAGRTGVKVGILSCGIGSGAGFIITSSKPIDCVYQPAGGGRIEHYQGVIRKLGIDIGVTAQSALVWSVIAPGRTKRGALKGYYTGASVEATAIIGPGVNVLIGGFRKSISLQPVSLQMQTGLNVAAGITGLRLDYVGR
jgi:hypothetical protein